MKEKTKNDIAVLFLRLVIGIIFFAHGMQKIFGVFQGSGIDGFISMIKGLGFSYPLFWAWAAALSEGLGGLFLILGVMPRSSAFFISIVMIVAIIKIHGPKGFFMSSGGFEYPLMLLSASISILLMGAGKYSIFNRY